MNKIDKNEIEFTKNLLNQSKVDILTILKNEKINYFMLMLPDLIKKDLLPNNLDLSHIEDDTYVFGISSKEFNILASKNIKLSGKNIELCLMKAIKNRNIEEVDFFIEKVSILNQDIQNLFLISSNYKVIDNDLSIYTKILCKYFDKFSQEIKEFGIKNIIKYSVKNKKYETLDLIGELLLKNKINFLNNHQNYFIKAITRLTNENYEEIISRSEMKKYQKILFKEAILQYSKEKIDILLKNDFLAKEYIESKAFTNIANGKSLVSTSILKNSIIRLNKELKVTTEYQDFEKKIEIKNIKVKKNKI
jgi:hypothetical protein